MLIERERKKYNQKYEALYKKADLNMDKNLQNKDEKCTSISRSCS
jgi:hypothetical protein